MGPFTKFQSTTHGDGLWPSGQHSTGPESFYHQHHDGEYPSTAQVPVGLKKNIVRMFSEDASGTSAVAIDNKIEQAMDLVKSHLMIAVREEVEVLKEKISELMDKINQLEVENTILKSNMSQETLHQLQLQAQLQIAGNGTANLIAAAQQPTQQQTQSQQPTAQPSQTPSSQQPNQQPQQQAAPQANPANTTNGPMS